MSSFPKDAPAVRTKYRLNEYVLKRQQATAIGLFFVPSHLKLPRSGLRTLLPYAAQAGLTGNNRQFADVRFFVFLIVDNYGF